MANITFLESGTDATQDLSFYPTTSGAVTSDTSQSVTGPRSLKCNTGAGPTTASAKAPTGVLADAGRRINCNFRFTALPGATVTIVGGQTAASANVFLLQMTTAGKLQIVPTGATTVLGTTVLSVNTWYRLSVSYTYTNSTTFRFDFRVNGNLEGSATAGTMSASVTSILNLQAGSNFGANVSVWFDNVYVDDGSDYADPGAGVTNPLQVTNKRSFANGTTNGFTTQIGSGGSGYGTGHAPQVNEQPLSTTNGWSMIGVGSAVTEEYNVENASTGDVNLTGATIKGVRGWVYAKSALAETGSIVVDGTSTNIALTSTNTLFTQNSATPTVFPAGTGTDIGVVTSTTVTTVSLYECGVLVCFNPAAAASTTKTLAALGVG